jgi:predicted ATP-grasp superfamily ATP-dependent carboligase
MMKNADQWMKMAEELRRECRFGEAINAFRQAALASDATKEIKTKARVSVELIQEINGFVNVDLMNP